MTHLIKRRRVQQLTVITVSYLEEKSRITADAAVAQGQSNSFVNIYPTQIIPTPICANVCRVANPGSKQLKKEAANAAS